MIVVDEAHHTYAKSYQRTIEYIMKLRKDAKLLGLTATPIRGTDNESKALMKLFGDTVVYNISMGELIKKQVLADPRFEQIQTNTDFEAIISIDEEKLIKKYGEIPATLADKIAHSSKRNKIIVDTYMKNKEHYGKTLIFALNIFHCYTLCQELQARGVKCDYIFSGNSNNELKIINFKEGKLDVLVNVNILTEGSDVPDIETVFLTRPTQSEGLLMQMIGRGMRGKYSGGTDKVTIVDFNDKWETFNKWLNPQWIIGAAIVEGTNGKNKKEGERVSIPWKLVSEIYQGITFKKGGWINRGIALPSGWCSLVDEDGNDYVMFVWESQLAGFKELMRDKEKILRNKNLTPGEAILAYFGGFVMPPSLHDLKLFLENAFIEEKLPRIFPFTNRKKIDPTEIAPVFLEQNVGIADIENKVREIYDDNTDIIQDIYGDFETYYDKVFNCIKTKNIWHSISADIEEIPIELIPYRIEPTHNIKELAAEVIDEMFNGKYDGIESIEWTDKPYSSYYGIYYLGGKIRINKLLDSPFVDKEVVKFVIYHELLHRDYWNHDKAFFREEHKYPDYTEHNRFLDHLIFNYNMSM